jgi:hypothetical protein
MTTDERGGAVMARVFRSQQDVADARLAYLVERE